MNQLVSIIIPVYNVERYLADTLESVRSQTHKNIEVVCVDDGSTDNSLSVLNFYSQQDPRIKVITQDNAGVSAARNNGIKHSKGSYICFLDSDDFMHPQNIEFQLQALLENCADIAVCNFKAVAEDTKLGNFENLTYGKIKVSDQPLADFMHKKLPIDSSSCNKLYRRQLVEQNLFVAGVSRGEDEIFVLNLLTKITRLTYNPQILVYFRNRAGSLTKQTISETYLFDHYRSFVSMHEILNRPEIACKYGLDQQEIRHWLAKKIYKRFVVHVLRKNKNPQLRDRLMMVSNDYIQKLIATGIFDPAALPLTRRLALYFFRRNRCAGFSKLICKL